jgi:hypothetical protein
MISNYIYQLPRIKDSILNYEPTIINTIYINQPKPSYGFHYYVKKNREKLLILNEEKYKNKDFYNIVNPFYYVIPEYNNSIDLMSQKYFNIDGKTVPHLSLNFFSIWEILMNFNFEYDNVLSINDDGEGIRASMLFNDKITSNKKCIYNILENKYIKKDIIDYYESEKKTKFKKILKISEEYDLIISMTNIDNKEISYIEQESYKIMINELINTLKFQKKDGNSIFRIYDTYTNITIKFLAILAELYENIIIIKPLTSKLDDSEKYIICLNYKKSDKWKKIENINIDENMYINDIFIEYNIPIELEKFIVNLNNHLCNDQYLRIANIMTYIESGNYFGDLYHNYRKNQIESHDSWLPLYYPLIDKDLKISRMSIDQKMKEIIEKNKLV